MRCGSDAKNLFWKCRSFDSSFGLAVSLACAIMRARMLSASTRALASRSELSVFFTGGGGSRNARAHCMVTLLVDRVLPNQTAVEKSVDDHPQAAQISQWS